MGCGLGDGFGRAIILSLILSIFLDSIHPAYAMAHRNRRKNRPVPYHLTSIPENNPLADDLEIGRSHSNFRDFNKSKINEDELIKKRTASIEHLTNLYYAWKQVAFQDGQLIQWNLEADLQAFKDRIENGDVSSPEIIRETLEFLSAYELLTQPETLPCRIVEITQNEQSYKKLAINEEALGPKGSAILQITSILNKKWVLENQPSKACFENEPLFFFAIAMSLAVLFTKVAVDVVYPSEASFWPAVRAYRRTQHQMSIIALQIFGPSARVAYQDSEQALALVFLVATVFYGAWVISNGLPLATYSIECYREKRQRIAANEEFDQVIKGLEDRFHIKHLKEMTEALIDPRLLAAPAWNEIEECPICWENYQLLKGAFVTPCGHKFHKDCMSQIQGDEYGIISCPICRIELVPAHS